MFEISRLFTVAGLTFFVLGLLYHWYSTKKLRFTIDKARPRGSQTIGIVYAFTIGMLPWVKESTRKHWIAYLRGVVFHLGIFVGLFVLIFGLFVKFDKNLSLILAFITGLGAVMGFAGFVVRFLEKNLKLISTIDDYLSVLLVSIFLSFVSLSLLDDKYMVPMYLLSSLMLFYAPLSKIRHCLYFFFSRFFFGKHLGRRGIVHKYAEASYGK
jgi:hypothetical protein